MAVASAAVPAGIDVLLSVLSCEVNAVSRLVLGLAWHAGVAVRDIKATRVACVPVHKTFNDIGIRGRSCNGMPPGGAYPGMPS